jgi:hypothetical protein
MQALDPLHLGINPAILDLTGTPAISIRRSATENIPRTIPAWGTA